MKSVCFATIKLQRARESSLVLPIIKCFLFLHAFSTFSPVSFPNITHLNSLCGNGFQIETQSVLNLRMYDIRMFCLRSSLFISEIRLVFLLLSKVSSVQLQKACSGRYFQFCISVSVGDILPVRTCSGIAPFLKTL